MSLRDRHEQRIDAHSVHAILGSGGWVRVLRELVGESFLTGKHGPCPACGGKDRFRFDNGRGRGDFICGVGGNGCGAGDGFALVSRTHGVSFAEALRLVAEVGGITERTSVAPAPVPPVAPAAAGTGLRWSPMAEGLWRRSEPLRGSLAARYLERRRCVLPPEDGDLRFLQPTDRHPAAMVARITDAATCEPLSLHFTRLAPDGSKLDRRLLAGHVKRGGVIRLWPDSDVRHGLAIAEGIESALSAAHVFAPVWSCIDAGNLAAFPVLSGIESLRIYADNDPTGLDAARTAGRRWRDAQREVRILTVEAGDANDAVRGAA